MVVTEKSIGALDGKDVKSYSLSNGGVKVVLTDFGARITELWTPDRKGQQANIVLGFDNLGAYLENSSYLGCLVGRYANRIAKAKFTLNGKVYSLAANNGPNSLHGGLVGFDKKVWRTEKKQNGVRFSLVSPDMEEGFPGTVHCFAEYELNEKGELSLLMEATTDKATPINLTNHAYFNLKGAGKGNILDHVLTLNADRYTPVDDKLIPTGELKAVAGTPMDFRTPHVVGERLKQVGIGYDHNYVINPDASLPAAKLHEKGTGRVMEVFATQPGIQLYTGNFLSAPFEQYGALCLETQHFPDSVNQPSFPSAIVNPGETYRHRVTYKFAVA